MFIATMLHKRYSCCFCLQFHLPTQEGKEGRGGPQNVYSFSNKETNYNGLSNCMGNSRGIFSQKPFVPNPIKFTLLHLVNNGLTLCKPFQRTNLPDIFFAVKKTELCEGRGAESIRAEGFLSTVQSLAPTLYTTTEEALIVRGTLPFK